jgi:hypothetical protein
MCAVALRVLQAEELEATTVVRRRRLVMVMLALDLLFWVIAAFFSRMLIKSPHKFFDDTSGPTRYVGDVRLSVWLNVSEVSSVLLAACFIVDIVGVVGARHKRPVMITIFLAGHVATTALCSIQGVTLFIAWRLSNIMAGVALRTALEDYQVCVYQRQSDVASVSTLETLTNQKLHHTNIAGVVVAWPVPAQRHWLGTSCQCNGKAWCQHI